MLKEINNPRSGEQYLQRDLQSFAPTADKLIVKTVNDLEARSSIKRSVLLNYDDIYEDNRKSLDNLFNQLLLLEYAENSLIDESVCETIVFCRDDILIKKNIFRSFVKTKACEIIIPGFHWHKGYNDRFMFGTKEVAKLWARRIENLEKFHLKQKNLSGEKLLKFTLNKKKISILALPRVFPRIRHNDILCKERNTLSINRPIEFVSIIRAILKFLLRAFTW
jgi:hypothetical protein